MIHKPERIFGIIALAALTFSQAAQAQSLAARPGQPTARDMYVACVLYLNHADVPLDSEDTVRPYSAQRCDIGVLPQIAGWEGRRVNNRDTFCLPHTPEIDADPRRAMALAYVDHYERIGRASSFFDGTLAFLLAMTDKWPCAGSRK